MELLEALASDPRVTVRRRGAPNTEGRFVVYWMQRAQRAIDNPALETAVKAANILSKPVVVFFGLVPDYPNANLRHYHFLIQGLRDVADRLQKRKIGFVVRRYADHSPHKFAEQVNPCLVIGDENPLRVPEKWRQNLSEQLRVPFLTVDADVIVPSKLVEKEQYSARTIRPRIHAQLDGFLVAVGDTSVRVPWKPPRGLRSLDPDMNLLEGFGIDRSVQPVERVGGAREAMRLLREFIRYRLTGYAERRNRPELDGTSQLSPYLHFGHIGPHTVALAVKKADAPPEDKKAFLEELIIRRELAVNFVRFNPNYDRIESGEEWALRTLRLHVDDPRPYSYRERAFESAETHDPLWNAAQKQMVLTGWMHGYMRMYWAKKILEWSRSAEEAYDIAVRLNDRYELDGRDPNGYAGVAWAVCGKHDRAWGPERPVYGKVRYMSYASTSRKFDSDAYIKRIEGRGGEEAR